MVMPHAQLCVSQSDEPRPIVACEQHFCRIFCTGVLLELFQHEKSCSQEFQNKDVMAEISGVEKSSDVLFLPCF